MTTEPTGSSFRTILISANEAAFEITLNRPERRNAINEQMAGEIIEALRRAEMDRSVAAVILAGDERAFCSGADMHGFVDRPEERFDIYRARFNNRKMRTLSTYIYSFTKPLICAVEGACLGGGLELALFCDLIVAGETAQFGFPEARLGLIPGAGGTQNLPRIVGRALAKELIWTGRRFSAAEALDYGIVRHVVPKGQALAKAREIAAAIAMSAPLSVMMAKQAINRGMDMPLMAGFYQEGDLASLLTFSDDRAEGVRAFGEKREPKFKGQ